MRRKDRQNAETVLMTINTHHPRKWRLIDTETGQVYKWSTKRNVWTHVREGMLYTFVQSLVHNYVGAATNEPHSELPDSARR